MKVLIATSVRVTKVGNRLYLTGPFASNLKRYYESFKDITLCTRLVEKEEPDEKLIEVTDIIKRIIPLSKLTDIYKTTVKKQIIEAVKENDFVIARVHSLIAYKVSDLAQKFDKPCLAEVIGCAWDAYWNHGVVGKCIAPYMYFKMKSVVKNADYVLYVTQSFLQQRYCSNGKCVGISDVVIKLPNEETIENRMAKIQNSDVRNIGLMTSAAVDVKYKGQKYVIKAIRQLRKRGINVTYYLAGGGSQKYLNDIAKRYGVEDNVVFLGNLSLQEVFDNLDKADIYIQPSLQEGLPRSVVEALSRGCICLGANTGGIPELIQKEFVFKRRRVKDIVNVVEYVCFGKDWKVITNENFNRSLDFGENVLNEKRRKFYLMICKELKD